MLAVASIDPTVTVLPNCIIDMVTPVQQIKRFIKDEGRQTMAHELYQSLAKESGKESIHVAHVC